MKYKKLFLIQIKKMFYNNLRLSLIIIMYNNSSLDSNCYEKITNVTIFLLRTFLSPKMTFLDEGCYKFLGTFIFFNRNTLLILLRIWGYNLCFADFYLLPPSQSTLKSQKVKWGFPTPKFSTLWLRWCRSGVFIVNFEHISHLVLVFVLLTLSR